MRFFCGSLRGCRTQSQIAELEKKRPAGISRNRFCQLMNICRSGLYYEPAEESKENQEIMKIMDMYFMDHPTTGKRGFRDYLRFEYHPSQSGMEHRHLIYSNGKWFYVSICNHKCFMNGRIRGSAASVPSAFFVAAA